MVTAADHSGGDGPRIEAAVANEEERVPLCIPADGPEMPDQPQAANLDADETPDDSAIVDHGRCAASRRIGAASGNHHPADSDRDRLAPGSPAQRADSEGARHRCSLRTGPDPTSDCVVPARFRGPASRTPMGWAGQALL